MQNVSQEHGIAESVHQRYARTLKGIRLEFQAVTQAMRPVRRGYRVHGVLLMGPLQGLHLEVALLVEWHMELPRMESSQEILL